MADPAPRVVVLGRPGDAQQQLQHALDELGAQTLAVGDFDQLDPAQMREQQPDVWLVSMDENTDAARLERWQPLFDDPDATVVFDDADVTRRLSGWDLARWARHLAAKVLGRNDVLPPVHPDAERLPQSSVSDDASQRANASMAMEADGVEPDVAKHAVAEDDVAEHDVAEHGAAEHEAGTQTSEPVALSLMDDADFAALSASFDAEREQQETDSDAHPPALALDDLLRAHSDDIPDDGATGGAAASSASPASSDTVTGTSSAAQSSLSLLDMDADLSAPQRARVDAPEEAGIDVSHLALEPLTDPAAVAAASVAASANGGLIAIIAGLGGPDAVRQFLGALPLTLPVPVLLWQHLDAGKHDRLAQQLGKATKLPVYLAKPGELARPGAVGVMGKGLGVIGDSGWWFEKIDAGASNGFAAALNDPATIVTVLSGAESAIVEPARAHGANGGQVLVQTPSTCFDGTAASALEGQSVTVGSPAELAVLAAARWVA